MWKDAAPSRCDVDGCGESAFGCYLASRGGQMLEFAICQGHHLRLSRGEEPAIVDVGFSRSVLVLD